MSDLALRVAQTVLQKWNGDQGFPPSYFETDKGRAIVASVKKVLEEDKPHEERTTDQS